MSARFRKIEVYPSDGTDALLFHEIDAISLVNDDTYGPVPVFSHDADFEGVVLYVNPQNIAAMEVTK